MTRRLSFVLALLLALVAVGAPAWAWWKDQASGSASFTAGSLTPVPSTTCSVSGNTLTGFTATITWTVQTSPTTMNYSAALREVGPLTVTTSGNTATTKVTSGLLGSLLGSTVHVDIQAMLPGTSWVSAVHTRGVSIALLGLSMTCGADG